jgi:hypothetical protein
MWLGGDTEKQICGELLRFKGIKVQYLITSYNMLSNMVKFNDFFGLIFFF